MRRLSSCQRHRSPKFALKFLGKIRAERWANGRKYSAMLMLSAPFWGLFWWGCCLTMSLSVLFLPRASKTGTHFNAFNTPNISSFIAQILATISKNLIVRRLFRGNFCNYPVAFYVFACPTSTSSTSPLLSFSCLFFVFSLWIKAPVLNRKRATLSRNMNGLPPGMQPKSTLCFIAVR